MSAAARRKPVTGASEGKSAPSEIHVHNATRRPIAFRIPGRTCRVPALGSVRVPGGSEATQELCCLLAQGKLWLARPEGAAEPAAGTPRPSDGAEETPSVARKRRRKSTRS